LAQQFFQKLSVYSPSQSIIATVAAMAAIDFAEACISAVRCHLPPAHTHIVPVARRNLALALLRPTTTMMHMLEATEAIEANT
jgi:hypothetical protein